MSALSVRIREHQDLVGHEVRLDDAETKPTLTVRDLNREHYVARIWIDFEQPADDCHTVVCNLR